MDSNGFYSFDQSSLPQRAVTDFSVPAGDSGSNSHLDPLFGLPGYQPFNPSILPQHAVTGFSVPDGNAAPFQELPDGPLDPLFGLPGYQPSVQGTLNQSVSNESALNGSGLNFRHLDSPNEAAQGFNASLSDYQAFIRPFPGIPATSEFEPGPFNDNVAFGAPYSFNQMTLPQGSVTNMFAPNAPCSTNESYSVDQTAFDGRLFATGSVTDASFPFSESEIPDLSAASGMRYHSGTQPIQSLSQVYRPILSCDWPGCKSAELFPDQLTRSQHVSATHVRDVLQDTSGTCTWPGCTKANLHTSKKLELHVTNVHLEPLLCPVEGCKRIGPFGRKGDLDRHISSVHKRGRTWKCPRHDCNRHIRGFPRKDKLDEHILFRGHGIIACRFRHCFRQRRVSFTTQAELISHYNDHGDFECGIGACKDTISAFTLSGIAKHLYYDHTYRIEFPNMWLYSFHDEIARLFTERSEGKVHTITRGDLGEFEPDLIEHCCECSEVTGN